MALRWWSHTIKSILYELLILRPVDFSAFFFNLLESARVLGGASLDGGKVVWGFFRQISPRGALILIGWSIGYKAALIVGLGTLYVMATLFLLMLTNFETRRAGDLSAYSVFNSNFERLPGTLDAEQFDAEIRHQVRWHEGEEDANNRRVHEQDGAAEGEADHGDAEEGEEEEEEVDEGVDSRSRYYWKEKRKQVREMHKSEHDDAEAANRRADELFRRQLAERRELLLARLAPPSG